MTSKMICKLCEQVETKIKNIFTCDGCNASVCRECGKLAASELKVLQLTGHRTLKFYCPKCTNGESMTLFQQLLQSKETIIEDKTAIISILRKEIDELRNRAASGQNTYSNAVKKQNKETIIVKPKDSGQSNEITKRIIEEKIDPNNLGERIEISKVKYIRNGGVAIKFSEEGNKDVKSVCENIKNSLGQGYEVKIPEKKSPRIIVFDIHSTELDDENVLVRKLVTQNILNADSDTKEIKLVHKYQNRKGKTNIILQLDKLSYESIKRKERISIGWKTYYYKDSLNIKQCFHCWKFGHIAKECKKSTPTCQICAGEHKQCESSNECCVNCKYAVEVLKISNIDYRHRAYDRKCETYKNVVRQLQEKIDYPELHSDGVNA